MPSFFLESKLNKVRGSAKKPTQQNLLQIFCRQSMLIRVLERACDLNLTHGFGLGLGLGLGLGQGQGHGGNKNRRNIMEIWIDTFDNQAVAFASQFGILFGVTTNPSLLAKADSEPEKVINKLLDAQDGPVAVQVTADEADGMISQALALHAFSDRIIVKIPVTQQGLLAMKDITQNNISVMATAVFDPNQALLAALAGADYCAPYIGRMFSSGIDALVSLQSMKAIYDKYQFKTKLIAAALQSTEQIGSCAEMGIPAITLKEPLFAQFLADQEFTLSSLEGFASDWENMKYKSTLLLTNL